MGPFVVFVRYIPTAARCRGSVLSTCFWVVGVLGQPWLHVGAHGDDALAAVDVTIDVDLDRIDRQGVAHADFVGRGVFLRAGRTCTLLAHVCSFVEPRSFSRALSKADAGSGSGCAGGAGAGASEGWAAASASMSATLVWGLRQYAQPLIWLTRIVMSSMSSSLRPAARASSQAARVKAMADVQVCEEDLSR